MEHFRKNFFFYILITLVLVVGVVSYNRILINQDYLIEYEGECDPATEECFTGCEDETCTEEYYYTKMIKYAPDLYQECGSDITNCETANVCLPDDHECSVTYCDTKIDDTVCETFTEEPETQNSNQESSEEKSLPINENLDINL
jgi:hypothetical protein